MAEFNVFESVYEGIALDSVYGNIVSNNVFRIMTNRGISLWDNSDKNIVSNNRIYNSVVGATGITTATGGGVTNDNNYIFNNYIENLATGIYIQGTNNTVKNNILLTCTTPINNAGTLTVIRNNEGFTEFGDLQINAGNIEMYNGTAWVIIGP